MNISKFKSIKLIFDIDILKKDESADTEEKKEALKYLDEALHKKDAYIKKVLSELPP